MSQSSTSVFHADDLYCRLSQAAASYGYGQHYGIRCNLDEYLKDANILSQALFILENACTVDQGKVVEDLLNSPITKIYTPQPEKDGVLCATFLPVLKLVPVIDCTDLNVTVS